MPHEAGSCTHCGGNVPKLLITPGSDNAFDGQSPLFFPGNNTLVSEFLCAVPRVKAYNLSQDSNGRLMCSVRRLSEAPMDAAFYDETDPPTEEEELSFAGDFEVELGRIGRRFSALQIDAGALPRERATNPRDTRRNAAILSVLRGLDTAVAQGATGATPPGFAGLADLVTREPTMPGTLEDDLQEAIINVCPNGNGFGDTVDCLVGSGDMLRKLARTASGSTGFSGWKTDARTGRFVYHYMGIPFYRCNVPTVENETTLYALNLGPTGVHLIYAYGDHDTFGLVTSELSSDPVTGKTQYLLHGAYALVLWEREAAYKITVSML